VSVTASVPRDVTPAPRRVSVVPRSKRAFDLACAAVLIVLLAPLLLLIAVLIRLDSPGSPIFRQVRVGIHGRRFRLLKFRTMRVGADRETQRLKAHSNDPDWLLLDHDPRVTRVGRILRHTSLDELPQLWHVVRGDMSLVGPRPLSLADDSRVTGEARIRSEVLPGMTGLWQVSGRTEVSFKAMLTLDAAYVSTRSFRGDLQLLLRTVPAVLLARGVN
jgi:lipopolysaccharide/colanic/teichoic acid biosynthesis glycosyltransferase